MEIEPEQRLLSKTNQPLIKNYKDYRLFLRDYYSFKKSLRSGFSFRQFSAQCEFKSPNYLQLIMKGDRNLSEDMAPPVATAIGLKSFEKDYFVSLVRQENSKTDDELKRAQKESLGAIKKMVTKQIPNAQDQVLSEWYHLLIHELLVLKDFEPSGEYICRKLDKLITLEQATDSWNLLVRAGFVTQTEAGKWIQKNPVIDAGNSVFKKLMIHKYHSEHLKLWSRLLISGEISNTELGMLNIPIRNEKIPELKERIQQFQDEIIGWLQEEKNPDSIVQLGTYMFKVVEND